MKTRNARGWRLAVAVACMALSWVTGRFERLR